MNMTPASTLPRGLRYGSLIVALGGLVPFLVSTVMFLAYVKSEANPGQPWLAGQFPPGPASFTLDDIRGFSADVATAFVTAQHIELVNVMNSGVLVLILALYGLRRYQKWSWWALLFTALWPGLNDAAALIAAHDPPVALVGEGVTLVGLALARSAVFARHAQ
jgi:hypothetical protein